MRTKKPSYKKGNGYCRTIIVGYDDDGKPIPAYARGRTKAEMNEAYKELQAQVQRNEFIADRKMTVSRWADAWLKATQSPSHRATYAMYNNVIENHIKPRIGSRLLWDLTEMDIIAMKTAMKDAGLTRTIQQTLMALDQMLDQAVKSQKMRTNVASGVGHSYIRQPKTPITETEWDAFEAAQIEPRDRLMALLPLYATLRKEEALALKAGDYSHHRITISRAWVKERSGAGAIKDFPKSQAGYRTIACPEPLDRLLDEVTSGMSPNDFIFTRQNGKLYDAKYFEIRWQVIKNRANIAMGGRNGHRHVARVDKLRPDIKYHELRHTFATCAYYAGIDIKRLQYLMGHEQSKLTLDVYTHLESSHYENPYPKKSKVLQKTFRTFLELFDKTTDAKNLETTEAVSIEG